MTTFRIRAEFDFTIKDDALAREVARQFMVGQVDNATMKGERIDFGTTTPAEAIDDVLNSPQALASLVATTMITRGAAATPSATCSNLDLKHLA